MSRLDQINAHPRDQAITFYEPTHTYTIHDGLARKPTSVTTLIHHLFPAFDPDVVIEKMMRGRNWENSKYYGKSKEDIKAEWAANGKEASENGTTMHADIENYLNGLPLVNPDSREMQLFFRFWETMQEQYPEWQPYRTEWVVYDAEVRISGSIDLVMQNRAGELMIVDWKRSKEIKVANRYEKGYSPFSRFDSCNYNHYALQLNFYRHILHLHYGKRVVYMMLVVLHPQQDDYLCYPVPAIDLTQVWPTLNH